MRTFHIISKQSWQEQTEKGLFANNANHYISLPNGMLLLSAEFRSDDHALDFAQNANAMSLPHPVWNPTDTLHPDHADILAQLTQMFPDATTPEQRQAIARQLTVHKFVLRAARLSNAFRLV